MAQTVLAPILYPSRHSSPWTRRYPQVGSSLAAAAPDRGSPAPRLDDHAGVGRSNGAGPSRGAIAAAWSAAPTVPATPSVAAAARAQPAPPGQPSPTGVGPPAGGAPRPRAATPAVPRPWLLSAVPAAAAIPAVGRRSDRAVVAPSTDHLRHRIPRRTRSSEPTVDSLAPTCSPAADLAARRWSIRSELPAPTATSPSGGRPDGLAGAGYWGSSGLTLAAWAPFGPWVMSNSTAWPSSSER